MRKRVRHPVGKNACYVGTTIDPIWDDFQRFLADMGDPSPGLSLDRINNSKPYGPGNCRWADVNTQARNKRKRIPPIGVAYAWGQRATMSQDEIAAVLGCSQKTVSNIFNGVGF